MGLTTVQRYCAACDLLVNLLMAQFRILSMRLFYVKFTFSFTFLLLCYKLTNMMMMVIMISGTNANSQTFTPFAGASFVNDCRLQYVSIIHVDHLLLQFSDITDPLISIVAL